MNEVVKKIDFDPLSKEVVDCAYKIHQTLGTGLLENIYEDCFAVELEKRGLSYERQKVINVDYEGVLIPTTYKLDLVVENKIIVELKSVEKIISAHQAQILKYLKTSNISTGLLINFGEPYFKAAIKRFVV